MLSLLLLPVAAALAASSSSSRHVRSLDAAPSGWTKGARVSNDTAITLRLALPAADPTLLEKTLMEVSDPSSSKYGQYLSREEAGALLAPTSETSDAVKSWLAENDLTASASAGGDMLMISTTVGVAERLLSPAEYYEFHSAAGTTHRTLSFGVPAALNKSVEFVVPSTLFPPPVPKPIPIKGAGGKKHVAPSKGHEKRMMRTQHRRAAPPADCAKSVTPECLRTLYNLGDRQITPNAKNAVAIFSNGGHVTDSDVSKFLAKYVPAQKSKTIGIISVDNGNKTFGGEDADVEADLDVDVVMGLVTPGPSYLAISSTKKDFVEELLDTGYTLGNMTTPPSVLSMSYGYDEAYFLGTDASETAYAQRACAVYGQLGTRGVSTIVASGDGGVTGNHGGNCKAPAWRPIFPASCPYVTAVAATHNFPETTVQWSGAGLSNLFSQPSYQSSVVKSYLKTMGSYKKGFYNASGRAYPDVAARGVNYEITAEGSFETVSGTSASTPAFAAIVAHLNDVQLKAKKPMLGFLNPWIYGTAGPKNGFTDVTEGYSKDCGDRAFNATKGYDLASGFGTPLFDKLSAQLP